MKQETQIQYKLPPQYNPKLVEEKWYRFWEESGFFYADVNSDKPAYVIVIPPPNITGILHIGHALNNTLQDILIRWKRMQGYNCLWLPGTDHASIATHNVIERELAKQGKTRFELGREAFLKLAWEWKEKYGSTIINQLKKLGCSCDWSRERFTMDAGLSRAVREVFVRLYEEKLIYRGNYIINWCPHCRTAISDDETEHVETKGYLYYIKYPLKDSNQYLTIATTRPETMLGDTAVAVHPSDERYKGFIGKTAILPVAGIMRLLPIIADEYVDPAFGTGVLKITPAHDPNDFQIGLKHNLEQINILNPDATINENGGKYAGLDRYECRKRIVEDLKAEGLIEKIEEYVHAIGHCYRCHTPIEPYLSLQWFVKMRPLAEPAIETVKKGEIRFIPENWTNTYFSWLENVRDWCISRQLWWGHRIPVWYCSDCGQETVSREDPSVCNFCGSSSIIQDPDILDTWFSSALWPFSTLGWPDKTKELEVFYPTSVLVTAHDIIFFWVARMIMMGLKFMGAPPFRDVYIHALVRDVKGRKMSKSAGNIIDPVLVMEQYGTDALRFTLCALAAQGRNINLAEERIAGYRNFCNKIWNAARFVLAHLEKVPDAEKIIQNLEDFIIQEKQKLELADSWILSQLNRVIEKVNESLTKYEFDLAAQSIYQFFWHTYCDWYLELIKPRLSVAEENNVNKTIAITVAAFALDNLLRLLHPIMPFITEEIWSYLFKTKSSIMIAQYPIASKRFINPVLEEQMQLIIDIIVSIRDIRDKFSIPPDVKVKSFLVISDKDKMRLLNEYNKYIYNLAKVSDLALIESKLAKEKYAEEIGKFSSIGIVKDIEIYIPIPENLIKKEEIRLTAKIEKLKAELTAVENKLKDQEFLEKAPVDVVNKQKERHLQLVTELNKLQDKLRTIKDLTH